MPSAKDLSPLCAAPAFRQERSAPALPTCPSPGCRPLDLAPQPGAQVVDRAACHGRPVGATRSAREMVMDGGEAWLRWIIAILNGSPQQHARLLIT